MSIKHLNDAFGASLKKSSHKFILVALADYANEVGEAYPSTETICSKTSLDRKTVLAGLSSLSDLGFIEDTGQRKGKTGQVKVWHLSIAKGNKNSPKNGMLKESQKRNSTENGTVPFLREKNTKNGMLKESQKRDIEPSVLLTTREPSVSNVADHLAKKILTHTPTAKPKPNSWLKDIDLAMRVDERKEDELIIIIDWIYSEGSFWIPHVRSGKKLREKYDTMFSQKITSNKKHVTKDFDQTDYTKIPEGFN